MAKKGNPKLPKDAYDSFRTDSKGNVIIEGRGKKRPRPEDLPDGAYEPFTVDSKGSITNEKSYKKGGAVTRGDGCAQKGKTKGKQR